MRLASRSFSRELWRAWTCLPFQTRRVEADVAPEGGLVLEKDVQPRPLANLCWCPGRQRLGGVDAQGEELEELADGTWDGKQAAGALLGGRGRGRRGCSCWCWCCIIMRRRNRGRGRGRGSSRSSSGHLSPGKLRDVRTAAGACCWRDGVAVRAGGADEARGRLVSAQPVRRWATFLQVRVQGAPASVRGRPGRRGSSGRITGRTGGQELPRRTVLVYSVSAEQSPYRLHLTPFHAFPKRQCFPHSGGGCRRLQAGLSVSRRGPLTSTR